MDKIVFPLLVIFLPGIITTIIADKITNHSKWNSFKFGLYSFVLGFFTYASFQIILYSNDIILGFPSDKTIQWSHLHIWNCALNGGTNINAIELIIALIFVLPVALIASWIINYKIFNKIAKLCKISYKYGDENLFSYYLNAKEIDWLYIRDAERNFTYQGRIDTFSENEKVQEIVLSEVTVYNYEDSEELYTLPTLYLCREVGKLIIEQISNDYLGEENDEKETIDRGNS